MVAAISGVLGVCGNHITLAAAVALRPQFVAKQLAKRDDISL